MEIGLKFDIPVTGCSATGGSVVRLKIEIAGRPPR